MKNLNGEHITLVDVLLFISNTIGWRFISDMTGWFFEKFGNMLSELYTIFNNIKNE